MTVLKKLKRVYGKRALAMLLLFSLLFTSMSLQAMLSYGDSDQEHIDIGGELECVLYSDGRLVISGNGGSASFNQDTAPLLKFADQVRFVEIEDGVTSLGDYLFYGCGNLSGQLILPESLVHIGKHCFGGRSLAEAPKFDDVVSLFVGGEGDGLALPGMDAGIAAGTAAPTATDSDAARPFEKASDSDAYRDISPYDDASPSDATGSDAEEDPWAGPGLDASFYPEQVIDGDIFYPGQSGNYYGLDSNESFLRAAHKAGYSRAKYGARFTLSYGEGPLAEGKTDVCYYRLSGREEASIPKLPELFAPGTPEGLYEDIFTGWMDEAGEMVKAGTKVALGTDLPEYAWTAQWERKPIEIISEQTMVTEEDGYLRLSVGLRDVPGFTLSCQWYVSGDYRQKADRPEDAVWEPVDGATEPVWEKELSEEDQTKYYACEVTAVRTLSLGSTSRIEEESDNAEAQYSEPATLGLIPSVKASATVAGKLFDGAAEELYDAAAEGQYGGAAEELYGAATTAVTADSAVTVRYELSGVDAEVYGGARIDGDFPAGSSVVMTAVSDDGTQKVYYYKGNGQRSSIDLTEFTAMNGADGAFGLSALDRGDGVIKGTLVFVLDYRDAKDGLQEASACGMTLVVEGGEQAETVIEAVEADVASGTDGQPEAQAATEGQPETQIAAEGQPEAQIPAVRQSESREHRDISATAQWTRGPRAAWTVSLDQEGQTVQLYGKNPLALAGSVDYRAQYEDTRHEGGYTSLLLELYDAEGSTPVDFPMGLVVSTGAGSAAGIISGNRCVVDLGQITDGSTPFTVSADPGSWGFASGTYVLRAQACYGAAPGSVERQAAAGQTAEVRLSVHNPEYVLDVQEAEGRMGAKSGGQLTFTLSYTCSDEGGAKEASYQLEVLKKGASGYEPAVGESWAEGITEEAPGTWTVGVPEGTSGTYRLHFTMTVQDPWRGNVNETFDYPVIVDAQ